MVRSIIHLTLIIAFASCAGCNKAKQETQASETQTRPAPGKSKTGIAVLDLNRVATASGELERIQQVVKEKEQQMLGALKELEKQYDDRISDAKLAAEASDAGDTGISQLEARKQQEMLAGAQTAQSQLLMHSDRLRQAFHSQVRPIAQQIAEVHGCNMVLTAGQVFSMSPDLDITDKVIAQLKTSISATAISEPKAERYATLPGGGSFVPR